MLEKTLWIQWITSMLVEELRGCGCRWVGPNHIKNHCFHFLYHLSLYFQHFILLRVHFHIYGLQNPRILKRNYHPNSRTPSQWPKAILSIGTISNPRSMTCHNTFQFISDRKETAKQNINILLKQKQKYKSNLQKLKCFKIQDRFSSTT